MMSTHALADLLLGLILLLDVRVNHSSVGRERHKPCHAPARPASVLQFMYVYPISVLSAGSHLAANRISSSASPIRYYRYANMASDHTPEKERRSRSKSPVPTKCAQLHPHIEPAERSQDRGGLANARLRRLRVRYLSAHPSF